MENNKENCQYTWYPENSYRFYETYDNLEEMIKIAKKEYDNKTGEFYGNDDRYSPVINVGTVENINYDSIIETCYDAIKDAVNDYVDDFAFGMYYESECYYEQGTEEKVKEKLNEIVKRIYINPTSKCHPFKEKYDLINDCWVNEN